MGTKEPGFSLVWGVHSPIEMNLPRHKNDGKGQSGRALEDDARRSIQSGQLLSVRSTQVLGVVPKVPPRGRWGCHKRPSGGHTPGMLETW